MPLNQFVSELRGNLSPEACVLTDASSKDFQLALLRWSDVGIKVPGAIVKVTSEHDAVMTASLRRIAKDPVYSTDKIMIRSKPHPCIKPLLSPSAAAIACGPQLVPTDLCLILPTVNPFGSTLVSIKSLSLEAC